MVSNWLACCFRASAMMAARLLVGSGVETSVIWVLVSGSIVYGKLSDE